MKVLQSIFLLLLHLPVFSQWPDRIYDENIKTVMLYQFGNQVGFPIIRLNGADRLELHFDDMQGNVKNYSYTFLLCNADWTPAMLSQFDYIKGFSQQRISTYRVSSIAYTRYTHYTAVLPDRNCYPSRSGNYILKVFADGDTSKLLFTKRMLVLDDKSKIIAQIQQPYNGLLFRTHNKVHFRVDVDPSVSLSNPYQQVNVSILQNERWDNVARLLRPSIYTRNSLEYNTESEAVFPAGKEWRWLDLRSLRFQSDRIAKIVNSPKSTEIIMRPDLSRTDQQFNFYRDINGHYTIQTTESINPFWQGDYATVQFSFLPPGKTPFADKNVFLFGQLTNYDLRPENAMVFNEEKGVYEKNLFLKQGYYDYMFVTVDKSDPKAGTSFEFTEGNLWESENDYMILVYYRSLGGRADELIGFTRLNSRNDRTDR